VDESNAKMKLRNINQTRTGIRGIQVKYNKRIYDKAVFMVIEGKERFSGNNGIIQSRIKT
jgi:hypothetical protein